MQKPSKPSMRKAFFHVPQPNPAIIPHLKVCADCGTVGLPKEKVNGSVLAESAIFVTGILALAFSWLLTAVIFTGLAAYFVWLSYSKSEVCPTCENPHITSYTSPPPAAESYLPQNSNPATPSASNLGVSY
ncbi:MAG TPA: hypothetical protein VF599_17585 [Pyrinomonadaceae bacterium]|jgi:hypothetical protein